MYGGLGFADGKTCRRANFLRVRSSKATKGKGAAPAAPQTRVGGEKESTVDHTVLIADEDVNAQIIAETLLRLRGLRVLVAADGAEVCDYVRDEDVAVVVIDLSLPGMNGFELLRRLRGRFGPAPLGREPRILAVTNRGEPEVERFARRLGADAFLRKPLVPRQFIATVEQLVGGAAPQAA